MITTNFVAYWLLTDVVDSLGPGFLSGELGEKKNWQVKWAEGVLRSLVPGYVIDYSLMLLITCPLPLFRSLIQTMNSICNAFLDFL